MPKADSYLKAPYARILVPDEEGGFVAEILEFPGCVAQGSTADEAVRNLERGAKSWIEAAISQGQEIPEPLSSQSFSGRVALRLPRSLHGQCVRMAERDGTSLNQYLVTSVAARVGADDLYRRIADEVCDRIVERVKHVATVVNISGTLSMAFNVGQTIATPGGTAFNLIPGVSMSVIVPSAGAPIPAASATVIASGTAFAPLQGKRNG